MAFRGLSVFFLGAVLCSGTPAYADSQAPLPLQPISNWHASLEDGICHLRRTFSIAEHRVELVLRKRAPFDGFEIYVVADGLKRRDKAPVTIFGPDASPVHHELYYNLRDGGWEGFSAQVPHDYFDTGIDAPLIVIDAFEKPIAIPFENGPAALAVFDQCLDEVLRGWGLDPDQQRSLSSYISEAGDNASIGADALKRLERVSRRLGQPDYYFLLMVDDAGTVTSCRIEGKANETHEGRAACDDFVRRARFKPALDKDGEPVASYVLIRAAKY